MASEGYHEPIDELSDETRDMHRAIVSLMEEWRLSIGITNASMPVRTASSRRYLRTIAMKRKNMRRWCWSGSDAKIPLWIKR